MGTPAEAVRFPSEAPPTRTAGKRKAECLSERRRAPVERERGLGRLHGRPVDAPFEGYFHARVRGPVCVEAREDALALGLGPEPKVHGERRVLGDDVRRRAGRRNGRDDRGTRGKVRERVGEKREARHLEEGGSPFLRLEARVGGHAREARRHETGSFPRDFRGSAIARRLEDEHAVPVQGLADEEIARRAAPDLFVRRQEERHALRGLQVAAHDGFEDGDCHRHAALHVEDAWPPGDALLDTERDFRQRAGGPDGVDVAEQERAPALGAEPYAEGVAPARAGHAGGRDPRFLEPRRDPARELADERRLARRALADHESLEILEHRTPPRVEVRGQVAGARAHARSSWIEVVTRPRTSGRIATPVPGPVGTGMSPSFASRAGSTMSSSK